jgi:hypothetical protein
LATSDGGLGSPESVTEPKFRQSPHKLFTERYFMCLFRLKTLVVKYQFKFYELEVTLRHQLTAVNIVKFPFLICSCRATRQRSCLRHYATSRKVAGSITDEIIGSFSRPNISSHTMALESTQPLTEMSTRDLPGRNICVPRSDGAN